MPVSARQQEINDKMMEKYRGATETQARWAIKLIMMDKISFRYSGSLVLDDCKKAGGLKGDEFRKVAKDILVGLKHWKGQDANEVRVILRCFVDAG